MMIYLYYKLMNSDTWLYVFQSLDINNVAKCRKICKTFNEICKSQMLWCTLYINNYSHNIYHNLEFNNTVPIRVIENKKNNYFEKYKLCKQLNTLKKKLKITSAYGKHNSYSIRTLYGAKKICLCYGKYSEIPKELDLLDNLEALCMTTEQSKIPLDNPIKNFGNLITRFSKFTIGDDYRGATGPSDGSYTGPDYHKIQANFNPK